MPHPSHNFVDVNYNGTVVQSCSACKLDPRDAAASEPCGGSGSQGGLQSSSNGARFASGIGDVPGPSSLPPGALTPSPPLVPVAHLISQGNGKALTARELVESLSSEVLLERLMEAEGEVAALRVLLQAAEAREKAAGK